MNDRDAGRREYMRLQDKHGNAPEVEREYNKGCRGWSMQRKMAVNIQHWEKMERFEKFEKQSPYDKCDGFSYNGC
jgi:hypothetical protein